MPEENADVVCGTHAVRIAVEQAPGDVIVLWVQEDRAASARLSGIVDAARGRSLRVEPRTREQLDRDTGYARHQGIALLRRRGAVTGIDDLLARARGAAPLLLVLDGVQDPQNLGACLRTADAAGADAVVIPKDRAVSLTPAASKVASGAAAHTPVITVVNLARTLQQLRDAGIWIVGLDAAAEQDLYELDLTGPLALVLGGEERGLRRNVREHCDHVARLPRHGVVESLNVAVAAGITLFEALRQRR